MKIVIISAVAPPEPLVTGLINWDICKFMAEKGNDVWLVSSFPSRPIGSDYQKEKKDIITKVYENFHHIRVRSYTCPEYRIFGRLYESFDFGLKSIKYINRHISSYDVAYISSWAFLGQLMILILRRNRKSPMIMNIQDLYPESFFTKLKSAIMVKLLEPLFLIDRYIAKNSAHITVVSETMKQVYLHSRRIPQNKVTVLRNWQDESEFLKPLPSREDIASRYGLKNISGKFVFMYLGNIGPVAGLKTVIEAFGSFRSPDCMLIIAGAGSGRDQCIELVERKGLSNIVFLSIPNGLAPVAEVQSIADILLLPIIPGGANSSIPSKLIAYMFSAKPVITSANLKSETAEAVIGSGCGWVTNSHSSKDWIIEMRNAVDTDQGKIRKMGPLGFDYAMRYYSKRNGLKKIEELFHRITLNSSSLNLHKVGATE